MDLENKKWKKGDPILINKLQWDKSEVFKVLEVLENDWFGGNSKYNIEFENRFSQYMGAKYCQTTNSGTSAIATAIQTLMHLGKLKRGDKILHPGLTFPTSISTAIQFGLIPVFADVDVGTYVISNKGIERVFQEYPDINGAIIPLLLGNTPDIDFLKEKLNGKPLIIDSCDVIGTKWDDKEVGTLGDIGCYSFYGSHHISTFGVGGALVTNNDEYYNIAKSIVFWGRDFETDKGDPVTSFLKRYSYKTIGNDNQMSAVQAAFGLAQLDRLPEFIGGRWTVFGKLTELFRQYGKYFELPRRVSDKAWVSWFCYPLELKKDAPFSRYDFVKYLTENKVETRPIMAGNLLDHPPYQNILRYVVDDLQNANNVTQRGFFLPAYSMEIQEFDEYIKILKGFLERF